MWSNPNTELCPIALFKMYQSLRPLEYCHPTDPFYISTNTKFTLPEITPNTNEKWFKAQPIGVNRLASLMSSMSKRAGIRYLTNHSARKHLVQKLSDGGIPATHIMQISGHKNVNSINNYSSININQQKEISKIISNNIKRPLSCSQSSNIPPNNLSTFTNINHATTSAPLLNVQPSVSPSFPRPSSHETSEIKDTIKELFQNCNMTVNTMSIHFNYGSDCQPIKRRRINVIYSDSDDD